MPQRRHWLTQEGGVKGTNAALGACKLVLIYHDYCFTTIRKLSALSQVEKGKKRRREKGKEEGRECERQVASSAREYVSS